LILGVAVFRIGKERSRWGKIVPNTGNAAFGKDNGGQVEMGIPPGFRCLMNPRETLIREWRISFPGVPPSKPPMSRMLPSVREGNRDVIDPGSSECS